MVGTMYSTGESKTQNLFRQASELTFSGVAGMFARPIWRAIHGYVWWANIVISNRKRRRHTSVGRYSRWICRLTAERDGPTWRRLRISGRQRGEREIREALEDWSGVSAKNQEGSQRIEHWDVTYRAEFYIPYLMVLVWVSGHPLGSCDTCCEGGVVPLMELHTFSEPLRHRSEQQPLPRSG